MRTKEYHESAVCMEDNLQCWLGHKCSYSGVQAAWILRKFKSYVEIVTLISWSTYSQSHSLSAIPVTDGIFSDNIKRHINDIIKRNFICQRDKEALLGCTYNNQNSSYCNESQSRPAGVYCFGQGQSYQLCN